MFGPGSSNVVPVGTWLKLPSPEVPEIMAYAGFDFVIVDLEHSPVTGESAYQLINSSAALGMTPLVRVPDARPSTIQKTLDMGAHGILVPHVESLEDAENIAQSFRFPPRGRRGAGGTSRAGRWGLLPTPDYLDYGNNHAAFVPQLESENAVSAAADILALPDVDAIFVGAADLALSLGVAPTHPDVEKLVQHALDESIKAGKRCGLAFGALPGKGADAVRRGCGFVALANDLTLLATASRDLVGSYRNAFADVAE